MVRVFCGVVVFFVILFLWLILFLFGIRYVSFFNNVIGYDCLISDKYKRMFYLFVYVVIFFIIFVVLIVLLIVIYSFIGWKIFKYV